MNSSQLSSSHMDLWVVDSAPDSRWFHYFDYLLQFALSRNRTADPQKLPLLFFCHKLLPAKKIITLDYSQFAVDQNPFKDVWMKLGEPSTTAFVSPQQSKSLMSQFMLLHKDKISICARNP